MAEFTIRFHNFCIFVHHKDGLAVLPGSTGHELSLVDGEKTFPVKGNVYLSALKNNEQVPGGPTREARGEYMPNLAWMLNRPVAMPYERVFGHERGCQRARIYLHGGRLDDYPAGRVSTDLRVPNPEFLKDLYWDFSGLGALRPGRHRITNRVEFSCPIEPHTEYALVMGTETFSLTPGKVITLENRDHAVCAGIHDSHVVNTEIGELLNAIGLILEQFPVADSKQLEGILRGIGRDGETCKPCDHVCVSPIFV